MKAEPRPRDRREAWQAVAASVRGTFDEGSKVFGGYTVTVDHGPWSLTLGLHVVPTGAATVVYTQVLAFFAGREDLRLSVRRRTWLDTLGARLGLGGLLIGDKALARRYVVRGRPETRVRSLLSAGLANALAVPGSFRVEVKRAPRRRRKTMGPHARQLQVLARGVDTDVDRMTAMVALARETLDVLQRVGAASAESAT